MDHDQLNGPRRFKARSEHSSSKRRPRRSGDRRTIAEITKQLRTSRELPAIKRSGRIRKRHVEYSRESDTHTSTFIKLKEVEIPIPSDDNEHNINYFTKDISQLPPSQEIVAKDLRDHVWKFKYTFKGTPQRHLFTSGLNEFAKEKSLTIGDSFVFLRKAAPQQSNISSSTISKQSMHYGLIATALNAIKTKCIFKEFYKPKYSGTMKSGRIFYSLEGFRMVKPTTTVERSCNNSKT
ncbi:hypothetical protein YC2023_116548 [Brassica napus]